jgi:hypothetical protein
MDRLSEGRRGKTVTHSIKLAHTSKVQGTQVMDRPAQEFRCRGRGGRRVSGTNPTSGLPYRHSIETTPAEVRGFWESSYIELPLAKPVIPFERPLRFLSMRCTAAQMTRDGRGEEGG